MLVRSKINRKNGTTIEVHGQTIAFRDDGKGAHVAEVTDKAILHRLINEIPTGYELYGDDAGKKVERPSDAVAFKHPLNQGTTGGVEPRKVVSMKIVHPTRGEMDLARMEKDELTALAVNEFGIEVHKKWPEATLRDKILEATRAQQPEE